jgi:signal transduction histidine kinase
MRCISTARRRRRIVLLGLVLAIQLSAVRAAQSLQSDPPPWLVLLLYSSDLYAPAAVVHDEALRTAMSEGAAPRAVDFRTEALDAVTFDAADYEPELVALFKKKHSGVRFDLLMPVGVEALRFVTRHREMLWPGVPIVSLSVSATDARETAHVANATAVTIDLDAAGTIRLARHLQPDAERLVLVAGESPYDRRWWSRLEAAAAREGHGLEVETLFGRPIRDVVARVSHLPRRSIVLYGSITRDTDGQPAVGAIVAVQLAGASTAPVYAIRESNLGGGVVGGSIESFTAQGQRAAAVALRVLRGTSAHNIPIASASHPVPMLDWRQLRRFGLSDVSLPPGSVVLHRPPSLMEQYRGYVIAGGTAIAVQTGLIVALLAQARRRRQAEAEASRQRAELTHAARLSTVGQLTAVVAHEINQPLGAILSNAEAAELFLDADPPQLERVRRILQDIQHEDQRASAVIHEVRALARRQSPEVRAVDLNDVVRGVMPLIEADARRRGVEVELDLAGRLPALSGDGTQLQQVVLNLALNALEALGPPGPGDRRVRISTRGTNAQRELTVSDTGPGLAKEVIPRLFESFFTTKAEGLGLGLSIVGSIVEAHGGRVAAENNQDGPGATFRVLLPEAGGAWSTRHDV